MISKVQTVGINKDYLIKLHKELLVDLMVRGFNPTDEKLQKITEMCVTQSKVFLFGLDELSQQKNDFTQSILRRFPKGYKGINHFISENYNKRSYTYYTDFLLKILQDTEHYIIRSLEEIESPENESSFLAIVLAFEEYLHTYFEDVLLPRLEDIESEIKRQVIEIYNTANLTGQEIVDKVVAFIDNKTEELSKEYANEFNIAMFSQAVLKSSEVIRLLELEQPKLESVKQMIRDGYVSNIDAYFFNETRRIKEATFENIFSNSHKRSLATQQIESIKFNKNVYSLSTITHARAMFRAVVNAGAKNYEYFKALVSSLYFDKIKPTGKTAQALYQIKTRNEWSAFIDNTNSNVVGGLSLHHNDVVYYFPVVNDESSQELAKRQRSQFLAQLK